MPQIPPLPTRGTIPDSIWIVLDKIITYLKSLTIRGDSKTIKVNQTDGGYTISAVSGPGYREYYFLVVTSIDADGCPSVKEWHKITIPVIGDTVQDPPTV